MSKIRTMGAGAANMSYGTNSMLVQIGDKLQGLPPTTNKRAELIPHIRRRADGDKRDWIFCINQLAGGVGRHVGQFAPGADGVKDCVQGPYGTPASLFNCDVWYRLAELDNWVNTQLSSMFATMSQATVDAFNSDYENYVGMALIDEDSLIMGTGAAPYYNSTTGAYTTLTAYMLGFQALLEPFTNPSVWPGATGLPISVPDMDITAWNGTTPPSTYSGMSALPSSAVSDAAPLRAAIETNLQLPANASVWQTIQDIANRRFQVPGYTGAYRYVFYILTETFVNTPIMQNMATWFSTSGRSGPNVWSLYVNSNSGGRNGLTQIMDISLGSSSTLSTCQNVCDIDQQSVLLGAKSTLPGALVYNGVLTWATEADASAYSYQVEEV